MSPLLTCDECGGEIPVGEGCHSHESMGYGQASTIWTPYCSRECRDGPVAGTTRQSTLELFHGDADARDSHPDAIAWSVA